jgi:hypothetical protein
VTGDQVAGKLGRVRSRRRRRFGRHKLLASLIVLIVIATIGGVSDLSYISLKSQADRLQANLTTHLQAGQGELEAGKEALKQANAKHDASLVTVASTDFLAAKGEFMSAGQLADDSRFLHYLEYVPAVGQLARTRHDAVDGIAQMGAALADAGNEVSRLDGEIIKPPSSSEAGRTLLTVLDVVKTGLVNVRADLVAAQHAAGQVDLQVLPAGQQATFLKARASIDSALTGFTEFERLLPVLTDVLGGNGPRTYLVEQVNPAELRPGGGFIGTYSLLQANNGSLTVVRSGDAYDLVNPRPLPGQAGFIPLPIPYREIIPNVSWSFVDSNIYPDFPSNALAAETFVQPRVGKVDAVISIDYYTVAEMLSLTGPLAIPGIGTLTAANFVSTIVPLDVVGSVNHKTALAAVAGPLMQRVAALPASQWPVLISDLNAMAAQRHLQAYFNNPTVQTEIDRVGWSGTIRPTGAGDFMMEVEANYWGNKTNYFLTRQYSIVLSKSGNTLHHVVIVDLINSTVCGSEDRPSYRANFRLFVANPASPVLDNMKAVVFPNPAPPAGTSAADGWVWDVNCGGGQAQATFAYDTPWTANAKGLDQLYWQKQPGTLADRISVTWIDSLGRSYTASGVLDQDRVINLSPGAVSLGAGHPAQATLPSLSLG